MLITLFGLALLLLQSELKLELFEKIPLLEFTILLPGIGLISFIEIILTVLFIFSLDIVLGIRLSLFLFCLLFNIESKIFFIGFPSLFCGSF